MTNVLKGIIWMIVSSLCFVAVTGIVRHLGSDMNAAQAAFIRYAFGTLFFASLYWKLAKSRRLPDKVGLHMVRGLVHGIGVMLWFYAMTRIPIADVTAIGFTSPIFVTVGAAIFLGETLHRRRISAVVAGFVGTLMIVRPGLETIELGAIAMLVAAPLFAVSMLVAKQLTRTVESGAVVAWLSLFVTLVLAPAAFAVWRTPTPVELMWLFVTASFATAGHYALTRAFALADLSVLQPFSFVQLVWALLLGYYVFSETPDMWTIIGGSIIVGSASYIAHREAILRRQ
jgi:drug/metabolite transporter (DMT)-like permease